MFSKFALLATIVTAKVTVEIDDQMIQAEMEAWNTWAQENLPAMGQDFEEPL